MRIWREPQITILSKPHFENPDHYPFKPAPLNAGTHSENLVEFAARLCYMSWGQGTIDGHKTVAGRQDRAEFFENIKRQKHGSVLEHANFSVLVEGISRSLSHEWVRHRAGWAYSQLSQRFVEPTDVGFVVPPIIRSSGPEYTTWHAACAYAADKYAELLNEIQFAQTNGKKAREAARAVLPNCAETKIVATANARAWRHFFLKRGALGADAEFRRLAVTMVPFIRSLAPNLFSDLNVVKDTMSGIYYIQLEHENV
jgi:thymidylate synthase (FAD)